jgi:hypothetical protein
MSQHLWSGRFDSAPDPAAFDFGVSFPFDRRLFEDDVTGSLAWAEALVAAEVLSADDGRSIKEALTAILASVTPAADCTPGARATSRYRSICVSISAASFRSCRRTCAPSSPPSRIRPRPQAMP